MVASLATVLGWSPLCGQEAATFARLQPGNFVEVLDLKKNQWHRVYQADAWSTSELTVSPTGDRLALLAWSEGVIAGQGYATPPAPALIVIDTLGRVLARPVPLVQRYAWCGRDCLVYLTGPYEETDLSFIPEGVGTLDVSTGKTTALPKPPTPVDISWAAFDGAAYVRNRAREGEADVYRLDLASCTLTATPFKDNQFSPTGRYYLSRPEFADSLVVYERATNKPVDLSQVRRDAKLLGWASAKEDMLLTAKRERQSPGANPRPPYRAMKPGENQADVTYKLYDVPARRFRQTLSGRVDRWVGPGHQRLVQQGGRYRVLGAQ
jgi:hypothetical protein